ncbi:MAG: hypothetical protein J6Y02_02760 [Pseudobutyrivibrio sp.]|nr:hypothetical protein [Pseudobutyrivibrio sp.]
MITDYEYERYFYTGSHRKCLLFVEQDANVTKVAGRPPQITKTGGTPLTITNDNILQEQFELQENFNSSENWAFGSVEPSAISFDIHEDGSIPILRDQLLRLYLYFDDDSSTLLYIGTYYIDEDEISDDSKSRSISGYDMIQSIRDIDIIDMYRGLFNAHEEPDPEDPSQKIWVPGREKITVKEARDKFFAYIADKENGEGMPIKQETVELPNDNFEFAFDVDTEALSGGQFLEDICEINGRYGHLGRKLSTASATKNYQIFQYIRVERYDEAGERIGNELRMEGMMKGLYQTLSIGKIRVYNRDSVRLAGYDEGYYKTKMSTYNIYDNILIDDLTKSKTQEQVLKAMMKNIYDSVRYRKYVPFNAKFPADLCREVGDRITLYSDIELQIDEDNPKSFKTLIFQRRITGIQNMVDTYSAKGDKKLPAFGDYSSSSGYSTKTSRSYGGSGKGSSQLGSDDSMITEGMTIEDWIEYERNINHRFPDEPLSVSVEFNVDFPNVTIKWSDPSDITSNEPVPSTWAGTVVVRREDKPPRNRWDGTEIVESTTRDEYKDDAYTDETIALNRVYYYGIFPYDTDGNYRPTKTVKVDTSENLEPPIIVEIKSGTYTEWDGSELDIMWSGDNNKLSVKVENDTITFTMYLSDSVIYTFDSPVGSTPADVKKIHVAFLEDETNHVAKPSFVYHTGSGVYSYNQEDPTDAEMANIYLWIHPPVYPPEYEQYIDAINGSGFFFKDWQSGDYTNQFFIEPIVTIPFSKYSYVAFGDSNTIPQTAADYSSSDASYYYMVWCSGYICRDAVVNVIKRENNKYYYTVDFTISDSNTGYWRVPNSDINFNVRNNANNVNGSAQTNLQGTFQFNSLESSSVATHEYDNLATLLRDLVMYVRNVDIYVEGELWSVASRT